MLRTIDSKLILRVKCMIEMVAVHSIAFSVSVSVAHFKQGAHCLKYIIEAYLAL